MPWETIAWSRKITVVITGEYMTSSAITTGPNEMRGDINFVNKKKKTHQGFQNIATSKETSLIQFLKQLTSSGLEMSVEPEHKAAAA